MPIIETEEYMPVKRIFLLFVFCVLALNAYSANISFLIVETGLEPETPAKQHSGLWESGLLDVFFEAGHIVSNAPILRLANKRPSGEVPREAANDLREAANGGSEFFVIAMLNYDSRGTLPDKVLLSVYRINPLTKIFEQVCESKIPRSSREEYDNVKTAAAGLIPHLSSR